VFAYWPTTIARERIEPVVEVQTASEWGSAGKIKDEV
jgi:hypothetical protein